MSNFDKKFNFVFGLTKLVIVVQLLVMAAIAIAAVCFAFTTSPQEVGAFFGEIMKGFSQASE